MEIARTILPMAKNLRWTLLRRAWRRFQQVTLLKKLQCKYAQGYYFSRPLSAEGIASLLGRRSYLASARAYQVAWVPVRPLECFDGLGPFPKFVDGSTLNETRFGKISFTIARVFR